MTHNATQPSRDELITLESRLAAYGAAAVGSETSLNTTFQTHLSSGGSRTRALLALSAGERLGLPDNVRFPIATAVELLHQASLIHDDIQDQDTMRRGHHAVWQFAGSSAAICLGDDLIASAFEELALIPAPYDTHLARLIVMMSRGVSVMAAGQTLDCQWTHTTPTSLDTYEQIVRHKSGPLLGLPIAMTLAVADGTDHEVTQILSAASSIGVAYQLADDLLDRDDDHDARLNGYWVIARHADAGDDIETLLRHRFDWHLEHARHIASKLPQVCIQAFEALIAALHAKYPSLQQVA
jgi:geranylgeranyl diphosphate synthase type II